MIVESIDNKTHLLQLDGDEPVFNGIPNQLLTKCDLWVEKKKLYNLSDIKITCEKCLKSVTKK